MKTLQEKGLEILQKLKHKGMTLEQIARSLADPRYNYPGPTLWTIQRALAGRTIISTSIASRILAVHGKKKKGKR